MLHRRNSIIALLMLIIAFIFYFILISKNEESTADVKIENLPYELSTFKGSDTQEMDLKSRNILRLTKYIQRNYIANDSNPITVYIGYWKEQSGDYQSAKHSPALCLPSNGWITEAISKKTFNIKNSNFPTLTTKRIYAETRAGQPYAFYYWFFCGKETYNEEWQALLRISMERLFNSRSDGGIVEISVPLKRGLAKKEAIREADETVEKFLLELIPELNKLIY